MPFKVIYDGSETRVNEYPEDYFKDGEEKHDDFESAQQEAIGYLQHLIEEAKQQIEWLKSTAG